jgi:hypothetical protein
MSALSSTIDTGVALSDEEKREMRRRLAEQETIAETALAGTVKFVEALETIRSEELYMTVANTWEAYWNTVWRKKTGRYADLWKRHLNLRDACREAGLPTQALPQAEKVSRAALKNIPEEQAVGLFQELHNAGITPTQSQVKKLRQQKGYEDPKRKTKTVGLSATAEDKAVY